MAARRIFVSWTRVLRVKKPAATSHSQYNKMHSSIDVPTVLRESNDLLLTLLGKPRKLHNLDERGSRTVGDGTQQRFMTMKTTLKLYHSERRKMVFSSSALVLVLMVVLMALVTPGVRASEPGVPSPRFPIGGKSTRRSDLSRRIQSYMIQQKAIPRTRSLKKQVTTRRRNASSSSSSCAPQSQGSIWTFQKPTKARVRRWFGVDEDAGNLRCMLRKEFNHGRYQC